MSIKSSKYIPPSLRKNEKKNYSFNDFPSLNNCISLGNNVKPIEVSYKDKLEKINQIKSVKDELPDGWIRLSTYKPTPKEYHYPDLTPTEEFIMIMDICSKNRANYYKSRLIEPPDINIPPPEYEDIEYSDSNESDLDMEDPEYEKIMNKFEK